LSMNDGKYQPGINCEECGQYVEGDYVTDTDHRRKYNGDDVCVSCYSRLKVENGGYST